MDRSRDRRTVLRDGARIAAGAATAGLASLMLPSAAAHASNVTPDVSSAAVGDQGPGGGLIFLTPDSPDGDGTHYYEIATQSTSDVSTVWLRNNTNYYVVVSGTSAAVGAGPGNTALMRAAGDANVHAATEVAAYAGGGLTDWFLPSTEELRLAIVTLGSALALPSNRRYWTSVQKDSSKAELVLSDGTPGDTWKAGGSYVQPVRRFLPPS